MWVAINSLDSNKIKIVQLWIGTRKFYLYLSLCPFCPYVMRKEEKNLLFLFSYVEVRKGISFENENRGP